KITGGTGADKIVAAAEISAGDVIDGGAGEDTLSVTAGFSAATGTISNIEVVELAAVADQTVDADDAFAGVTKFVVSGTHGTADSVATYTINDVSSGVEVTVTTVDTLNTDTAYDDVVTVGLKTDGTTDTGTVNIGSATVASLVGAINVNDLETVALSVGSKDGHVVESLSATDATAVTMTGAGNITLTAVDMKDAVSTFDASAHTGNITATFSDAQTQTIKTGSGIDTVKISDAGISAYDVFDLGDGADTLQITDVGAAVTATLNASNVETLRFDTAASGSINMDLSKATSVETISIVDGGIDGTIVFDFVKSGTKVQFYDVGDSGADTHSITGVTGAAAVTIEVADLDGSTADTYDINNFAAVTLNQVATTLAAAGDSTIADLDTGAATSLSINNTAAALTLSDVSTATLTSITVAGSKDVTLSAGGATTIKTITAATLDAANNAAELVLGTGASIFARATDAVITGSDGADTISMSVATSTHNANVIDAGDNATVSASVTGDLLSLGGSMTGDTVIDLSSTTDQITSLSGVTNAAVQKGFESVDASAASMVSTSKFTITGSDGINHITGGSGADVINAGGSADVITGGLGADTITGGTGADTFIMGGGIDTVVDFAHGAGGDVIDISSTGNAAFTGSSTASLVVSSGTAAPVAAVVTGVTATAVADGSVLTATHATYASFNTAAEILNLFQTGASFEGVTSGEEHTLLIAFADTGDTHVWDINDVGGTTAATEIAVLSDVSAADLTLMTAANFVV
ncbi:calcium-binding protein, partial [Planktomarina temperata]|nr:calcium-binding protein [Planktomarina temperata]